MHQVTLIPGDGIGPEVTQAAREVVAASGAAVSWEVHNAGLAAGKEHGTPLPQSAVDSIRRNRLALKGPTQTPFGVHVIMLLERLPGHVVPAEERRTLLREEVVAGRATVLRDGLLERLRAGLEIDRSADALLALVSVEQ